LVIDSDLPEGTYELEVKVEDRVRSEKAMSFVKVVVRPVPELAFEKHVSLRIVWITIYINNNLGNNPVGS
jgi:hypothetical protein